MRKRRGFWIGIAVTAVVIIGIAGVLAYCYLKASEVTIFSIKLKTSDKDVSFETVSEWNDYYRMYVMYPVTTNTKISQTIKSDIDPIVANFRAKVDANTATTEDPYELNLTGDVNYSSPNYLNIVYTGKQSIDAKTVAIEKNYLFDRKTGQQITVANLFKDSSYLAKLSDLTRQQLPKVLGANYNQLLAEQGTQPTVDNFGQFQIDGQKNYVVVFQPGQVADTAVGVVRVSLPSAQLATVLTANSLNKLFPETAKNIAAAQKKAADDAAKAAKEAQNAKPQANSGKVNCAVAKCVALTFDDGPSPYTQAFVDTLQKYNAKATFFVIGRQVPLRSGVVNQAYKQGNDIGNHTWDHPDMKKLTDAQLKYQLDRTNQAIVGATGHSAYLVRPPYGSYNASSLAVAQKPFIMWSVDSEDWKYRDANAVYNKVMSQTKSGSVVLAHDMYPTTLEAFKRIIPDLIGKGYTLVTVTDMFGINPSNPVVKVYR